MKKIYLLPSQVSLLSQCNFKSSTRAPKVRLYEADLNIFSPSLFHFSTFHFLRWKEKSENNPKNSSAEKKREIKASAINASHSKEEKRKTLQKSKSLVIKPEININDLNIKVKQIEKFVNKGISVNVRVENPKSIEGGFEKIFSHLQKTVTENKVSAKISRTGQSIVVNPINADNQEDENRKQEKVGNSKETNSQNEGKS